MKKSGILMQSFVLSKQYKLRWNYYKITCKRMNNIKKIDSYCVPDKPKRLSLESKTSFILCFFLKLGIERKILLIKKIEEQRGFKKEDIERVMQ